jgi:hypothetical protein
MPVAFTASIFFFLLLIHVESEVLMPHEVGKFWKSKRQGKGKIAALMPLYASNNAAKRGSQNVW